MGAEGLHRAPWTFLTSHARVLLALDRDPEVRLRDVAATCHLTERTVQGVVADLEEAGYLTRVREGRRNHYQITQGAKFRHPAEADRDIAELLDLFAHGPRPGRAHAPHPDTRKTDGATDTGERTTDTGDRHGRGH
ncbi:helix-turn-helix domain-containing protein [Streptomyces sp. NPDC051577]|uniref:helix-turn-helix transcriptional regulator n=1 Tax=Streptomyces sp. NPDC051577 TaxID=3155166 RepID=UPI0034407DA0